jgi:putative ABC transport system permease protein
MRPPSLARQIVAWLAAPESREYLLGDLTEAFTARLERDGPRRARRWYWRQALLAAWHRGRCRQDGSRTPDRPQPRRLNMSEWWRDVRFGVRTLARTPVYAAVAVLTVALAIGANTVLFGIANPLLVRTLPIKDATTLGWVLFDSPADVNARGLASPAQFLEWRGQARSLTDLAARETHGATLTGHGDAEHVTVLGATASLYALWGLHASVGRVVSAADERPGAPHVALLSHHYWEQAFQAAPEVLGQTVFVDSQPTTIIGVMESDLELYGYGSIDLWTPEQFEATPSRSARTLRVVGRLAPGATRAQATSELRALVTESARIHPETDAAWTPRVISTREAMTSPETWILLSLLGVVVGFVLLIACANLANLVLTRLVARRQDLAVRQGLGASRLELVRPLLIESLLVGLAGGALALAIARGALRLINATAYDAMLQRVDIDRNVLIFTAVLSVLTPVLFSLWPALGVGRGSIADVLRQARTAGGKHTERRRQVLVGVQVALALSLLVMSSLILQTVVNYQHLDPGFDMAHELTFRVEPPAHRYPDDRSRGRFAATAVGALAAIPGVTAAAAATHLPVFDEDTMETFTGTLHDGQRDADRPSASSYAITPTFFRTLGIPVLAGRAFTDVDGAGSAPVVILGRLAAVKYFDTPAQALGRVVSLGSRTGRIEATVVGVVGDTHSSQVTTTVPQLYVPFAQRPASALTLIVQAVDPVTRTADIRRTMRTLDPEVAISLPKTIQQLADADRGDNRIVGGLFLGFAVLALVLAAGGLYGVIAYSVGLRQREIGVRLALGAAPRSVGRLILSESLRVTAYGVAGGLLLAWLLGQAAASVLYGVSPHDPATFGMMTALVFLVAVSSVCAPVARAMGVNPATVLRGD